MEKKRNEQRKMERSSRALFSIVSMCMMCMMCMTAYSQSLTINVLDAQFTQPAVERLIAEYNNKVDHEFSARVVKSATESADATVSLSVFPEDDERLVGRFVVLPVANSQSELLQNKKVRRGLNDKLKRQIYLECDVVDELDALEAGEKPLPGTVYTLCNKKSVTSKVVARILKSDNAQFKGKKILGREENLLTAVITNSDAVSYNIATLIYDETNRQPLSGLTVLPTDLDDNGKVSDEEREAVGSLDALTRFLESLPKSSVSTGCINIDTNNVRVKRFVEWVQTDGQVFLAGYGLLKLENKLTAQR